MPQQEISSVIRPTRNDNVAREETLTALERHRSNLSLYAGIDDLSALGEMALSGAVVAKAGEVITPLQAGTGARDSRFANLRYVRRRESLAPLTAMMPSGLNVAPQVMRIDTPPKGSIARPLDLPKLVRPGGPNVLGPALQKNLLVPLSVAYFVATRLEFADNTTVVVRQPHRWVTFIAEEIIIGDNVTFTYELPLLPTPNPDFPPGNLPSEPGQAPTPTHLGGVTGSPGINGVPGGSGFAGADAPEFELWALKMQGSPRFLLRGQDGTRGGRGQDGGKGGKGSRGRDEEVDWLAFGTVKNCKKGAGAGGDGGAGGNGGSGGNGGPGGRGGRLRMHAPADVLLTYSTGGLYVNLSGGAGGERGSGGFPGLGGDPGGLGRHKHCEMSSGNRGDGNPGRPGLGGADGTKGPDGVEHPDPIYLVPITEEEFRVQLTKPALVQAEPPRGKVHDQVTLLALRLSDDDVLLLDGAPILWTIHGPELAAFTVPAAAGGPRTLQVRQRDGTLSNNMTFYVLPGVSMVLPDGRLRPGTTVTVMGSGFSLGARVRVNDEDMPASSYVNETTMTFTLRPPQMIDKSNPQGEPAPLKVLLDDGAESNSVQIVIDTLRILVLGDSVAWGQGLREHEKFPEIVEAWLAAPWPGISRYTTYLAHSGATIGVGDNMNMHAIHQEIPTSYPTVLQQLDGYRDGDDTVDHVLITAGLNDVDFTTILNPGANKADMLISIDQHCRQDLLHLLIRVAERFPHATVVATNYFPILSPMSTSGLAGLFITAAGVSVGAYVGGAAAGGVGAIIGGALTNDAWNSVLANCKIFHEASTNAIARAVEEANLALPLPRVLFADPGFGPENAALTERAWLYGINWDGTPEDEFTYGDRSSACSLHRDRVDSGFKCQRASVGHPNPTGAAEYAKAICTELVAGPQAPLDDVAKEALLRRFVPILKMHPDELHYLSTPETFASAASLKFHHDGNCPDCDVLLYPDVSIAELGRRSHRTKNAVCSHVDDDRISSTEPRDVVEDEGFFLELSDARRDRTRNGLSDPARWTFYGRVMPRNAIIPRMFGRSAVALQYWFFYAYNLSTSVAGVGFNHEGDWEHVTVVIRDDAVRAVWFSAHNDPGQWAYSGDRLEIDGEHPVVYSAKGTHASYPTAGVQDRSDVKPDDETADGGKTSTPDVTLVTLGEPTKYPVGQEWLAYAGLWGELGETRWSSGALGPAFQDAWYTH